MNREEFNQKFLAAARDRVGEPWRHYYSKGSRGIDCASLVYQSAIAAGLPLPETAPYSREPQDRTMIMTLLKYCDGIAPAAPRKGVEIGEFRVRGWAVPVHLGIIDWDYPKGPRLIHSYAPAKAVVENIFGPPFTQMLVRRWVPKLGGKA